MTKIRFEQRPEGTATMLPDQPNARNYYRWIMDEMRPYLQSPLLDIGSGYATHLEMVLPLVPEVMAIDLSDDFVRAMREKFAAYPQFEAAAFDFGLDDVRHTLAGRGFRTITCLNVLEHIEDDLLALQHMREILAPQRGALFLQVPAHELLYGTMDNMAGHYRRYSARYLRDVLTRAGFGVEKLYFFNSFGALPWLLNGRVFRPKSMANPALGAQLKVYDRYFIPVLRRVEGRVRLPFGQSLMAVARA